MRKYAAEAIGTFALVPAGTGTIVVGDLFGGVVSHMGVPLTFGLVVMTMIYSVGDVSGAHLNPAVSLGVDSGAKEVGTMAGISVGATVCLCDLFAGPVTGASMNPARSVGPALILRQWSALWLYVFAPVIGAGLAVLGCRCVREPGCCT
jgi:glycerol uptake facilitator-like aquaporin